MLHREATEMQSVLQAACKLDLDKTKVKPLKNSEAGNFFLRKSN